MQSIVLQGDSLEILKEFPDESVQCVVTSPPYWGLRDYGVEGQLGLEKSPEEYVQKMVEVFREIRRVLRNNGTLWLNLGDSYTGPKGNTKSGLQKAAEKSDGKIRDNENRRDFNGESHPSLRLSIPEGLKPKDLVGIPWRVAFALQADGWYLRQDIIWHKPNPMPESVRDRCTKAHEYIFLLSKSPKYYFDHEAIKEPAICGAKGSQFHTGKTGEHQLGRAQKIRPSKPKGSFKAKGEPLPGQLPFRAIVEMRNKRSVWTVTTKPFKGAHFATFPMDLIEPCILAGSKPNDLVLDPFAGAGTTGVVCKQHSRDFLGIEINPEYVEIAEKRIAAIGSISDVSNVSETDEDLAIPS
jgi:DNA modification methylase